MTQDSDHRIDLGRQCQRCEQEFDDDEGSEYRGLWTCYGCQE